MERYLNLSTRNKLFSAFGIMLVLAAATVAFAYDALQAMRDSQRMLLSVEMANVTDLKDIRAANYSVRASVAQLMLSTNPAEVERVRERIRADHREIEVDLRRVAERRGSIDAKRDLLREFETVQAASIQVREMQILPLLARGAAAEARELYHGVQLERDRRLAGLADELVQHSVRSAAASVSASEQDAVQAVRWLVGLAALAMAVALGLTLLLARVLAAPLQVLSDAAQKLAAGDLGVELAPSERRDEAGVLSRTFAEMIGRLREMMRELGDGVSVLASSASEISASTAQVASGSAQSASAVAETSATAEEVKQTAKVTSDKAAEVREAAERAAESSATGLQSMDRSIDAMEQIQQQMDSVARSILRLADQGVAIGEIISTVNDLADQSNVLSVNAAIEAARAGEEGAGFRVVAQEIRSLSEQSKQATVQVRALLGEIQKATSSAVMTTEQAGKAVRVGSELSAAAAQSIRSMAASITESAHAAAQIAASAQQQAAGMDQVAYAMHNISQASAQNVAASRQTEAAAQGLQDLGLRLKSLVARYQT
ncbi:methyl-accepting chemotaxis protein [Ramlibacter sp. RBP-2]|uniref:Methyl-accepting chemotaxis protein n=1 Tax=Ramlibacter lithotrophicus TaxID=2606681 RepID=A0A7X6I5K5_9BURK|nr:methyl-accepting chemotaxis protein [Ramlibacter lithotrophicus]NKE65421.1 methyl-accepting chemotaxis protein [Ramlibacter lithotrophicus]